MEYDEVLDNLNGDEIQAEIDFIGKEPLTIKTTNAQDIYNQYQMFPKILVFDLRSRKLYKNSHLKCSVNFPVDVVKDTDFINFNPERITKNYIDLEADKAAFKSRKRAMCFIVAHQTCTSRIFPHLADLFDNSKFGELREKFSAQDILATRNAVLLYMALKKEKTREVYICRNSFKVIQGKYPFMCRFEGSSLYLNPKRTNGYPSEIMDRRLYLGDKTHCQNETIIHNLGITHILNISDCIPNKFEDSKSLKLTYTKVNIEDNVDEPIHHSFNLAYNFMEKAICPKKTAKNRVYPVKFDVMQQFSDKKKQSATQVYSAAKTNNIVLDLENKSVSDVSDAMKDNIYDIDMFCEKQMRNSHNQNRVLVHCAMGRSRSATMVIMYLMQKFKLSKQMAFDIAYTRREVVDPNDGFLQKLTDFETKLNEKSFQNQVEAMINPEKVEKN
jgi:predicted protein tyrosine phosphatase